MARMVRSVSFSDTDPYEMELLEFAGGQGPFSKYVKRLIGWHKDGRLGSGRAPSQQIEEAPAESEDFDVEGFI